MTRFSDLTRSLRLAGLGIAALIAAGPVAAADTPPKPDSIVMRMWPGPWGDAMAKVGAAFTKETGVQVLFDNRSDTAVSTLVQVAIAQKRTPPVDVFYTSDIQAYKDAAQGLTQPLTEAEVPNLATMLPAAKPARGSWDYVNVAPNIMTLLYRASAFPNGAPDDLGVLFDPKYAGRTYANSGSSVSIAVVAMLNGWTIPDDMDKIWAFIEAHEKPMNPIMGHDPELVAGFQRDEVDIAFSFPAIATSLEDPDIKIAVAKQGTYAFDEGVFIPKGLPADRAYWAGQFVNFLLSKPTLEMYCNTLAIPCLQPGLSVPAAAADDPSYPRSAADFAKIHALPMQAYAENQAAWDSKYDAIMK